MAATIETDFEPVSVCVCVSVARHLLNEIREFHADLKLGGMPKNALLHIPDGFLSYLVSVLRSEETEPLRATEEEWSRFLSHLAHI